MESREQRIATLATTLRSSGIAKSDSQAKMMAEDMIGVEEHVQKDYEVEHTRAHEYLQTAKNLGASRPVVTPIKQEARQEPSRRIEPMASSRDEPTTTSKPVSRTQSEYATTTSGTKNVNESKSDHNTHNSALEAIKAQIGSEKIVPLEDMNGVMEDTSYRDYTKQAVKSEPVRSEPVVAQKLSEIKVDEEQKESEPKEAVVKTVVSPIVQEIKESIKDPVEESQVVEKEEPVSTEDKKLDAQKLIDMMEEDGKMEEHTREIKEKPKDVKPKEAYAENSIDLAAIFGAGRK